MDKFSTETLDEKLDGENVKSELRNDEQNSTKQVETTQMGGERN